MDQKHEYSPIGLRKTVFVPRVFKANLRFLFLLIAVSLLLLSTYYYELFRAPPANCPSTAVSPSPGDVLARSVGSFKCNRVRSEGDEFDVWLCMSTALCNEGHFIIERRDKDACRRAESLRISENATTEIYAKQEIGPDAFHATFQGAEKLAIFKQEYLGSCTYKLPFRFSNSGQVAYDIVHIYRNYDYLNELLEGWPPIVLNHITPADENRGVIDVCPRCPSQIADPMGPGQPKAAAVLPLCSRDLPVAGSWIPAAQSDAESYKHSKYAWTPQACQMPETFEVGSGDACLIKYPRTVLFVGDSHVRVTFDGMARRLKGDTTPFYDIIKWVDHHEVIHNVTLEYQAFDPYLNDLLQKSCEDMLIYDSIFFNTGHWPASGLRLGGHWTTDRFVAHLTRVRDHLLTTLQTCRKPDDPLRLVWQGNHFFPLRNDDNVRNEEDWRTPPRLKYWDDLAEIVFENTPIARMNSYKITASMGDTTSDGCHYNGADALDAIINEGLHKLDLCRPRVKSDL